MEEYWTFYNRKFQAIVVRRYIRINIQKNQCLIWKVSFFCLRLKRFRPQINEMSSCRSSFENRGKQWTIIETRCPFKNKSVQSNCFNNDCFVVQRTDISTIKHKAGRITLPRGYCRLNKSQRFEIFWDATWRMISSANDSISHQRAVKANPIRQF